MIYIKFKRSTSILVLLRNVLRYLSITLIVFSIFSCGGRDTVKSASLIASNSKMSGGSSDTVKPVALVVSKPKMSTKSVINDRSKQNRETTNVVTLKDLYKDEKDKTSALERAMEASYKSDYILGPGDLLELDVFQVDELNRTVRVSSSGFIKLPLAGKIKVSGLTVPELETEISKRLERYLQEPVVSIFIKEYRSQSITILGAIKKPQVYIVTRQNYLLDILSRAGGLTKDAGDICYIQRGNETLIVNLRDLLIGGKINLNIPVYSKDIIHVPTGGIVFVSGAVRAPGSFNMRGTVTLTQAISMAKGLAYEAVKNPIKVYRDSGKETRDILNVDYNAILAEKAPDIVLKDKDVVIVQKSGIKGFIKSISGVLSIGGVSVRGGI